MNVTKFEAHCPRILTTKVRNLIKGFLKVNDAREKAVAYEFSLFVGDLHG